MMEEPGYGIPKKSKMQILAEKSIEAARSASRTAREIARKPGLADAETVQTRRDICAVCEFYDHTRNRCKKCGCMLRPKTAFIGAKCPINKW